MGFNDNKSVQVCRVALKMAISSREEERKYMEDFKKKNIKVAAVDIGGKMPDSRVKFIESALGAAKRNGLITDSHVHDGAVIGAMREAISQIETNINGLSVGGKIGIARDGEHLSVAVFLSVGVLQFNEVISSIAHRSVPIFKEEKELT